MDFARLREEGISHIESMSGEVWTDYNTADPGITLLEALCYAITDLGYRISHPIEDLLTTSARVEEQFLSREEALSGGPVTEDDYRKLFLDITITDSEANEIPAVLNAWLIRHKALKYYTKTQGSGLLRNPPEKEPYKVFELNGLYDLQLQLNPGIYVGSESEVLEREQYIFSQARQLFHANRNLCEDLVEVTSVQYHPFSICADIQLAADADIEKVHAAILHEIQLFLSPTPKRYNLEELLEKGYSMEEIYDGPVPRLGFFDPEELTRSSFPQTGGTIRSSDMIGIILSVPGVSGIPSLHLKGSDADRDALWSIRIPPGKLPRISENSPLRFYKDVFPFYSDRNKVRAHLKLLEQAYVDNLWVREKSKSPAIVGTYRNTGRFSSLANDLPALYGVGPMGMPRVEREVAAKKRTVQIRRLRSYITFFDQILANQAALLEAFPELLNARNPENLRKTYFSRLIEGIQDLRLVFRDLSGLEDENEIEKRLQDLPDHLSRLPLIRNLPNEILHQFRRNRQLDHLLARYAEQMDDYVLVMNRLFGGKRQAWEIIDDKNAFLREYPLISGQRARGYNILGTGEPEPKVWYGLEDNTLPPGQINVAGVVRRVARLTGIDNYMTRTLTAIDAQIYQENDEDDNSVFRWRIVDTDGKKVLLSSPARYTDRDTCIREMRTAVRFGQFEDAYDRKSTQDGRYYFNILNDSGVITGRRIEYFDTDAAREDAIRYLIGFLTDWYSEEGIFLIENLLLRPRTPQDNFLKHCPDTCCEDCQPRDPYSFQVSVVLPGYTPRFSNLLFREYFERTLRTELPAHILARICWISREQMAVFEECYHDWLEQLRLAYTNPDSEAENDALNKLLDILAELQTIYPPGTLHDCREDAEERPIVLNRSQLGTQPEDDLNPDD